MAKKSTRSRRAPGGTAARPPRKRVAPGGKASPPPSEMPEAQFVFRGTVLQRGTATMAEVEVSERTIVARVDEILHGADVVRDFVGEAITVQLSEDQSVAEGQDYIFHTNGWLFGASIAVVAVAVEPASDHGTQRLRAAVSSAPAERTKARAARADLVVSGQVTQVTQVARPPGTPISEHEPEWQEAVVRVHHVARGRSRPGPGQRHHPVCRQPRRALGQGAEVRRRPGRRLDARGQVEGSGRGARRGRRAEGPVSRRRTRGFLSEGSRRPRAVADRVGREEIMVKVVNVIPQSLSGETRQDSEPNIAVNPANHAQIAITAFTPDPIGRKQRPDLRLDRYRHLLGAEHHRAEPEHDDRHRRHHHALCRQRPLLRRHPAVPRQSAAERAAQYQLRRPDGDVGAGGSDATSISPTRRPRRFRAGPTPARTASTSGSTTSPRAAARPPPSRPASMPRPPARRSPACASRSAAPGPRDRTARRSGPAVHTDGTVYAVFYGWRAFSAASLVTSDVVVVRDDNWGKGASPFTALKDPSDNLGGRLVATGVQFTWNGSLGHDRLGGDSSIAVAPEQQLDRLHRVLRRPGRQLHDSHPPLDRSRPDLVGRPQDRVERQEPRARDRRPAARSASPTSASPAAAAPSAGTPTSS